jgi:YidC/Oxa1 family membrane protein insertase
VASTMVMSVTVDKNQQRIMLALPLVFAALIPNFPAGLILYWMTTNFWTLGQQLVVRRLAPPPQPATAAVARQASPNGKGAKGQEKVAVGVGGGDPRKPPPPPRKKKRRRR